MHTRPFDPEVDRFEELARLSPFPARIQEQFAQWYSLRTLIPENIIVLEDQGELIGVAHVFDGGLPWAMVDAFYVRSDRRSLAAATMLLDAVTNELQRRGCAFYTLTAEPRLAAALSKRYGFNAAGDERYTLLIKSLQESA